MNVHGNQSHESELSPWSLANVMQQVCTCTHTGINRVTYYNWYLKHLELYH